jgi:preprotein translocase subunit SecD
MTIIEESKTQPPQIDDAQLLFQEAKQRRRRRWLISGIVTVLVLAVLGVTLGLTWGKGGGGSPKSVLIPASITATAHSAADLSFRPLLCYASPLTLAAGQAPSTGPLPPCSPSTELTASNLQVAPDSGNINGYTSNSNIQADPQFGTYPSTTSSKDNENQTALLPGVPAESATRYVLGPVQLTGAAVKSANAQLNNGQWGVNLTLTPSGSAAWDALTRQQFHQIIGVALNGQVISAPITQPTQSGWSSFNGQVQISGSFTEKQAKAIAAEF